MAAAGGRLFLTTVDGQVLCLSGEGQPLVKATAELAPLDVGVKESPMPALAGGGPPKTGGNLSKAGDGRTKAGDFAEVVGAAVTESELGYHLYANSYADSKTIGLAVKKLAEPLTGTVEMTAVRFPEIKFTINSTKYDLLRHPAAAAVFGPYFKRLGSLFGVTDAVAGTNTDTGIRSERMTDEESVIPEENPMENLMGEMESHLPLRSMVLLSGGMVREEELQEMIDQVNSAVTKKMTD
jgi:hypothetical protein